MQSMGFRPKLVALLLLPSCFFLGCKAKPPPQIIRPVRTMRVGDVGGVAGREFPGRAEASEEVNLSFRMPGLLVTLPVKVGDVVKEGQLLAQIDPRYFEVDVQRAEADLEKAKINLQTMEAGARPEELLQLKAAVDTAQGDYAVAHSEYETGLKLYKQKAMSQEEFTRRRQALARTQNDLLSAQQALTIGTTGAREEDIAAKKAEIRSLEAALADAKNRLDDTVLVAPFAGRIVAVDVVNHQMVQANRSIVRLLNASRIEMTVNVPESAIALVQYLQSRLSEEQLKSRLKIVCTFKPSQDQEIQVPAKIKEIGTEASRATRTFPVTLIMDQPEGIQILPGFAGTARAWVELPEDAEERGFDVPASAVLEGEQGKGFVWLIDEQTSTVKRQEVAVEEMTSHGILVKGVSRGRLIATAGVHYLKEGQKVRILDETAKEESK